MQRDEPPAIGQEDVHPLPVQEIIKSEYGGAEKRKKITNGTNKLIAQMICDIRPFVEFVFSLFRSIPPVAKLCSFHSMAWNALWMYDSYKK